MKTVLDEYRSNGHPGFGTTPWNLEALEELTQSESRPFSRTFSSMIDRPSFASEQSVEESVSSYVPGPEGKHKTFINVVMFLYLIISPSQTEDVTTRPMETSSRPIQLTDDRKHGTLQ